MDSLITGWVAIGQSEVRAAVVILAFGLRTERRLRNPGYIIGARHFHYAPISL